MEKEMPMMQNVASTETILPSEQNKMEQYIIVLNGPAGSGKDTLADLTVDLFNSKIVKPNRQLAHSLIMAQKFKFAEPIVNFMRSQLGINRQELELAKRAGRTLHGTNVSVRDTMIAFSEKFMKPLYGEDIFGRLAAEEIEQFFTKASVNAMSRAVAVISDSGFDAELEALVKAHPSAKFLVVYLGRKGYSFEGDSRAYINLPNNYTGLHETFSNDCDLEDLPTIWTQFLFNMFPTLMATWATQNYQWKNGAT